MRFHPNNEVSYMRVHPKAIRSGHQRPSGAISGHQRLSEITCSSDIRRRARAIAMLFERFGSISWTVSFFALEGVAGVAAALASSLVSERPRVSPDEGGNQEPDEGGNQGVHVSHPAQTSIRIAWRPRALGLRPPRPSRARLCRRPATMRGSHEWPSRMRGSHEWPSTMRGSH
jgi:hypothetical protein